MSNNKRRSFNVLYKREITYYYRFIIAAEGKFTEREYFDMFRNIYYSEAKSVKIDIKHINKGDSSAPLRVLQAMKNHISKEGMKNGDQAWLVVDRDQYLLGDLQKLHNWSETNTNYGFALSNPCFEYFLLLHFDECKKEKNKSEIMDKLKDYLPNYRKHIDVSKIILTDKTNHDKYHKIKEAVKRAKEKYKTNDPKENIHIKEWELKEGVTTVFKLVENILKVME